MFYSKIKKIPKFWKIYIFTVTAVILVFCVILLVLSGYLRSYEKAAQEEAAVKRAEESQRLYDEKEAAERTGGIAVSRRTALVSAVSQAAKHASVFVSDSVTSSADNVMRALVASLNEKGVSAVSRFADYGIGRYEDPAAAEKYIDAVSGEYSYQKLSGLEYSLKKGGLSAKVTLVEGENSESGAKTYRVGSVSVSLPLTSCRITVPEGASLTVNGKNVTEQPAYGDMPFSEMIPSSFSLPKLAYYELDGFVKAPELKAYLNGEECTASGSDGTTVFSAPSDEKLKSELYDRICELTFAYSDYVAGDLRFNEIKRYLYPDTKFYDNLAGFDTRWYYDYHHIVNENAKITQFTVLSDKLISARIEFDQSLRNSRDNETMNIKISLHVYIGCRSAPAGADKSAWLLINAGS